MPKAMIGGGGGDHILTDINHISTNSYEITAPLNNSHTPGAGQGYRQPSSASIMGNINNLLAQSNSTLIANNMVSGNQNVSGHNL